MNSLALINEFLGQPPNASSHGFQIDHILEFCHWFMGALFVGWSVFFILRPDSFSQTAAAHCESSRCDEPHFDAFGIFSCSD